MLHSRSWRLVVAITFAVVLPCSGCAFGPKVLESSHGQYNEAVKQVSEEQWLKNIVRLRYNDNPERLNISAITTQYELDGTFEIRPFFTAASRAVEIQSFSQVLPFGQIRGANRPTISLMPLDNPDTIRTLYTPTNLDGMSLILDVGFPIETVLRIWVGSLNGVPNAVTASGPPRDVVPEFHNFQRACKLLQALQDRGDIRFVREEKQTKLGNPLPASSLAQANFIEANKIGLEYVETADKNWVLVRRDRRFVLKINPQVVESPEMQEVCSLLHLKPGQSSYEVSVNSPDHAFAPSPTSPASATLDMVTRSIMQASYFLAQGVQVPPEHLAEGLLKPVILPDGTVFDWHQVTAGVFTVHAVKQHHRPKQAFVAVRYRDYWYYIDDRDLESKVTMSLLLKVTRVNLLGGSPSKGGPVLTLPVGR